MSFAFVPRKFAKSVKPPPPLPTTHAATSNKTIPVSSSEGPKHDVKGKGKLQDEPKDTNKEKIPKYTDEALASLVMLALSDHAIWIDPSLDNEGCTNRSIPGILSFTSSLLPSSSLSSIQNIHLPPHHQDNPGDAPACKGFAFVTFSSLEDAQYMIAKWPWESQGGDQEEGLDELKKEATKFGFRALSKKKWDELKEEYIAYRQRLVDEINEFQDSSVLAAQSIPHFDTRPMQPSPPETGLSFNSPYPTNVLLFIKHIHPETNKTTLRKLFSTAFQDAIKDGEIEDEGLDYVDYTKGMDSCHLRLLTPTQAGILLLYFNSHPTVQSSGLDEVGAPAFSDQKIEVELVQGKREEVYWEKVPERVRRTAVEKGIALLQLRPSSANQLSNPKRKRSTEDEVEQVSQEPHPPSHGQPKTTPTSPYPYNCLLFVKHIHPETNKTTLRKLFSRAFENSNTEGLDYVDFNKGMDSCYLRLATPSHSTTFVAYFQEHTVFQSSGLDDTGNAGGEDNEKAITMELVQGRREELYWEKVPEKVRRTAVGKAIAAPAMDGAGGGQGSAEGEGKKKRRKRGKGGD
ncbi:hypothetical protein BDQ17DRAFT_1359966 [Cyathus striatus]|nr:hypothetical protein BDQ17DRAFT_1359966 [Cyathus striatus]